MSLALLLQTLYLAAFAALHSLLASLPFKRLAWRTFGKDMDPWYLIFYSLFAAVTLLPLVLMLLIFPGRRLYVVPSPWRWLMVAGQIGAGFLTLRAFSDAPHRFSIKEQLSLAENPEPLRPRGIYKKIRDPFLLSGLVQIWLTPFMTTRLLVVYLLTSLYLYLGSLHWESRLKAQFKAEYEAYQKTVPRVIPKNPKKIRPCY